MDDTKQAPGFAENEVQGINDDQADPFLSPIVNPNWDDLQPDDERQPIPFYGNISHPSKQDVGTEPTAPVGERTAHLHPRSEAVAIADRSIDDNRILHDPNDNKHQGCAEIAFGNDEGTKAYINDAGQLICIVQMVDMGPCGLVRARLNYNIDPDKDHPFTQIIQGDRRHGMGLFLLRDFDANADEVHRKVTYVDDRWPRVSTTYSDIDSEVSWVIKGDFVIQHFTIASKVSTQVKFGYDGAIIIDDPYMKSSSFLESSCKYFGGAVTHGATEMVTAAGPGGYIKFFATLFVDTQPVEMNLQGSRHDPFFVYSDAEYNYAPSDLDEFKKFHHLSEDHVLEMQAGDVRSITVIYHFESVKWTRDSVFNLYTSEKAAVHVNKNAQQERESRFFTEYKKAQDGENGQSMEKFMTAMWNETYGIVDDMNKTEDAKPQVPETQSQDELRAKPFVNFGGEDINSHRLLGFEWQILTEEQTLGYRPVFDEVFEELRQELRSNHASQFFNIHDILRNDFRGCWKPPFNEQPYNFLFRRHLQYLLYVTPFPVTYQQGKLKSYFLTDGSCFDSNTDSDDSLAQIRFLIDIFRLLSEENIADEQLKEHLQARIKCICKGYLDWAFDVAGMIDHSWIYPYRPFGSSLSVTGVPDVGTGAIFFLILFDAHHSLKLERQYVIQKFMKRINGFMESLKSQRISKSGLWKQEDKDEFLSKSDESYSRYYEVKIPSYSIGICLRIWHALIAVHTLVDMFTLDAPQIQGFDVMKQVVESLGPAEVREQILERFIYDHTFSNSGSYKTPKLDTSASTVRPPPKTRLIACDRAGTEKPHFRWPATAFSLCEGNDWGMFDKSPSLGQGQNANESSNRMEEWWMSLKMQQFDQQIFFKKINKYVLSLVLASNSNFSLSKASDAKSMVDRCNEVLQQSILCDGRISERFDPWLQKPLPHLNGSVEAVFLVPQQLLRQAFKAVLLQPVHKSGKIDLKRWQTYSKKSHKQVSYKLEKSVRSLKKRGYYAKIDESRIHEDPCEPDWLFYDIDIFSNETRACDQSSLQEKFSKVMNGFYDLSLSDNAVDFLDKLNEIWDKKKEQVMKERVYSTALVDDIVRGGERDKRKFVKEAVCFPNELLEQLRKPRERSEVKKRLISVPYCTYFMVLSMLLGSVGLEEFYLPDFILRHQMRGAFFRDETNQRLNTWRTELHLSFFCTTLKRYNNDDGDEVDNAEDDDPLIYRDTKIACPGDDYQVIEKCVISFQFIGDLNDRVWTCHHLTYKFSGGWLADDTSFNLSKPTGEGSQYAVHSQRKILEAKWFASAAGMIVHETRNVLNYVFKVIHKDEATFYTASQHDSFRQTFEQNKKTYALYGSLIKFLFDVKERLRAVQTTASEWNNRTKYREAQPRWTRNDEAAFREEIKILENDARRQMHVIEDLLQEIESLLEHMTLLRQWLLDDIGIKEARMSNRSADDVRIFTYATVIFLPLSFVSSTFAMTGPPAHHIVNPFIIACIVALAATILFLLNAGTPLRNITFYKNQFLGRAQDDSILEHAASQWKDLAKALHRIMVEVPARNVLMAFEIIQESRSRRRPVRKVGTQASMHDGPSVHVDAKGDIKKESKITAGEAKENRWRQELQYTRKRRRNMSQIFLGILLLPLVLFEFAVGFLWYNILDLLKLLFYTLPTYPFHHLEWKANHEDGDDQATLRTREDGGPTDRPGKIPTDTLDKEQKTRKELRDRKELYQNKKLEHFMSVPRLRNLNDNLHLGQPLKEARSDIKNRREADRKELKDLRRKYKTARKKVGALPGEEKVDFSTSGSDQSDHEGYSFGKHSSNTLRDDDQAQCRSGRGRSFRGLVGRLRRHRTTQGDLSDAREKPGEV